MAAQLPHLNNIERLSPRVIRVLGGNPSKLIKRSQFTLQGTNTYLIGTGPSRILLDTGEGRPAWLSSLKTALADESASVTTALLTHWHPDHVGGVSDLRSAFPDVKIHKHDPGYKGDAAWDDITEGQPFTTEGATVRAVHCPGHTADHMAFVLEEEGAMFTADNVLGHGTAVFEDLKAYMESLEKMKGAVRGRAYPGHGEVIADGKEKIDEYIAHRKLREEQVLGVLGRENDKRQGARTWGSMEIVKVVYADVPESLHVPAEGGVVQVLQKLEKDGTVSRVGEDGVWRLGDVPNL